jgi:hypothetical protein
MSVTPPRPQAHLGILGSSKIDLRVLPLFDAVVKADFPRTKISMSRTTLLCGRTRIVMTKMVPCQLRQFSRWGTFVQNSPMKLCIDAKRCQITIKLVRGLDLFERFVSSSLDCDIP